MDDLISRQDAIDIMSMALDDDWEIDYATDRMNELPSAQPKTQLSEEDATSDCISRQAAIHINEEYHGRMPNEINFEIYKKLKQLPSAQPEIIRCKDCKWKQGAECVRFAEVRPFPDDFCSRAERRTE